MRACVWYKGERERTRACTAKMRYSGKNERHVCLATMNDCREDRKRGQEGGQEGGTGREDRRRGDRKKRKDYEKGLVSAVLLLHWADGWNAPWSRSCRPTQPRSKLLNRCMYAELKGWRLT